MPNVALVDPEADTVSRTKYALLASAVASSAALLAVGKADQCLAMLKDACKAAKKVLEDTE